VTSLFKITKSIMSGQFGAPPGSMALPDRELLAHYCQFDAWIADLGTGIFKLSERTRQEHGLAEEGDCGLLNLVRCYETGDRHHVLELFETAAVSPSSFCFSTSIHHSDNSVRPVMCIGESSKFSDEGKGAITGVFVFPNLKLWPKTRRGAQ